MIPGRPAALIAYLTDVEPSERGRPRGKRAVDIVALTGTNGLSPERTIALSSGSLVGASVSPCGQRFAISAEIGSPTEVLWLDGRERGIAVQDEGLFALASATSAVVGRYSGTQLALVDFETQRDTPLEECPRTTFEKVATSPDGQWVGVSTSSSAVQIWRLSTGARERRLSISRVRFLGAPAPSFSPDSALFACGTSAKEGRSIRYAVELFEVGARWRARATLELGEGFLNKITFSRTGRRIVTAQYGARRADVNVWDRDTAKLVHHIEFAQRPEERPVVALLGTSDDDRLTYVAFAGERSILSFETP